MTPGLLRALPSLPQSQGKLLQRAIPSTGEKLPVIGLGFANHSACADPAALKDVLKTFVGNGGKFFDTNHGNAPTAQCPLFASLVVSTVAGRGADPYRERQPSDIAHPCPARRTVG
jgi:hypothetical protein